MRVISGLFLLFWVMHIRLVCAMKPLAPPVVDDNILVFDNQDHFEKVMNELIKKQERVDVQEERSKSDKESDVFADFAKRLQFESLAGEIERQLVQLEESKERDGGINEKNDPDEHCVSDPYLRGMLNPEGMIRIGDTTYRITKGCVDTYNRRELASRQDHLRKDSNIDDSSNIVKPYPYPEERNRGLQQCCKSFTSNTAYTVYAGGSRRIKSKQWVENFVLYKSIGAKTINYKKKANGNWERERAEVIKVYGDYCWSSGSCPSDWQDCNTFSKTKYNKKKVSYVDPWINIANTLYVRDKFNSNHQAVDNGGTGYKFLHMCPLTSPTPPPVAPPPPPTPSCMSGDTGVFVKKRRVATVKQLRVGDTIKGLSKTKKLSKCTVEAVGTFGYGDLYGNYTHDHFIYDPKSKEVVSHGKVGPNTREIKYEVFTSCPLGLDESGKAFTPIDSDFCGQHEKLSWYDYVIIHTAILRIVRASGPYWFTGSSYADLDGMTSFAPRICKSLLKCAGPERDCNDLDKQSQKFISFLTDENKAATEKAFPNMGKRGMMGSVSYTVTGGTGP